MAESPASDRPSGVLFCGGVGTGQRDVSSIRFGSVRRGVWSSRRLLAVAAWGLYDTCAGARRDRTSKSSSLAHRVRHRKDRMGRNQASIEWAADWTCARSGVFGGDQNRSNRKRPACLSVVPCLDRSSLIARQSVLAVASWVAPLWPLAPEFSDDPNNNGDSNTRRLNSRTPHAKAKPDAYGAEPKIFRRRVCARAKGQGVFCFFLPASNAERRTPDPHFDPSAFHVCLVPLRTVVRSAKIS